MSDPGPSASPGPKPSPIFRTPFSRNTIDYLGNFTYAGHPSHHPVDKQASDMSSSAPAASGTPDHPTTPADTTTPQAATNAQPPHHAPHDPAQPQPNLHAHVTSRSHPHHENDPSHPHHEHGPSRPHHEHDPSHHTHDPTHPHHDLDLDERRLLVEERRVRMEERCHAADCEFRRTELRLAAVSALVEVIKLEREGGAGAEDVRAVKEECWRICARSVH